MYTVSSKFNVNIYATLLGQLTLTVSHFTKTQTVIFIETETYKHKPYRMPVYQIRNEYRYH
jgi:hypothetical protein